MSFSKKILTAFFLLFIALILTHSDLSLSFSLTGLNLWFEKMIPTLLPFMILSGIMVRMNLTENFSVLLSPLLRPIFRISRNGIYCIIMGFLCGFPMGAKVITELYERKKLKKSEAGFLLAFCNNIGPVYFMGYALPAMGICRNAGLFLFGMYGIPLLYGVILRYTLYRRLLNICCTSAEKKAVVQKETTAVETSNRLLAHVDDSILAALNSITALGGYMILFNLLNLFPYLLLSPTRLYKILPVINGILEINGGLSAMKADFPLCSLTLLPFGGLSCMAQTYSILRRSDLSISDYMIHKLILTILTAVFYFLVL